MFYEYDVAIPANTTALAPLKVDLDLNWGVVEYVGVQIPDGVFGLAHLTLWYGAHQVAPVNERENIKGNNATIEWKENVEMFQEPFYLRAVAWNEDDTYPHTLTVRIVLNDRPFQNLGLPLVAVQQVEIPQELIQ